MAARAQATHITAVVASVVVVAAYGVIVAALNAPPAAHAPSRAEAAATASTTPMPTTTTVAVAPPIVPGTLRAPQPGVYAVRSEVNGAEREGTLTVAPDGTQVLAIGDTARQLRVDWSNARGVLVATGAPNTTGSCEWTSGAVVVPSNLRERRRWSSTTSCVTSSATNAAVTVRRQETANVTRRVRTQIGDVVIDTWLIERRVILTARSLGQTTITEELSQEFFAPTVGLSVYKVHRIDTSRPDGVVESVTETIALATSRPI